VVGAALLTARPRPQAAPEVPASTVET
jgi:hypothetical protein